MSFLHLSLLAGLAAVAVPIAMHLFGQRQPQTIDFPALRFVKETRMEQRTSWQLRHFLLLLLRILLLAGLALALARPHVHSSTLDSIIIVTVLGVLAALATVIALAAWVGKRPTTVWGISTLLAGLLWLGAGLLGVRSLTAGPAVPVGDNKSPIAAAIIVDNGPSMLYRADNAVRLDVAKERAQWILDQLPSESRVGLLGGAPVSTLALDPATAGTQVQLIEPRGGHVDLPSRVRTALDLVLASELERKEVYVLTDGMSASWASVQPGLKELLDEHRDEVLVQIIDLGGEDRANWALGDPKTSLTSVATGGDVEFEITVTRPSGDIPNKSATVTLVQEEIDPRLPIVRNGTLQTPPTRSVMRKVVDLEQQTSAVVRLSASNLKTGTHHFTIQLDKSDPLDVDNERFLSILARPAKPALVITDDLNLAKTLRFIANPNASSTEDAVASIRYSQVLQNDLKTYSLVWLHNPPPVSEATVDKIEEFIKSGGGVLCVLGSNLGDANAAQGSAWNRILPGTLSKIIERQRTRDNFLTPVALSHAVFQGVGEDIESQLWNPFGVYKNWDLENLSANTQIVMKNSQDDSPAVLSENVGQGQVITLTTPIPQLESEDLWNELWISDNPIPAFGLLRGAITALFGASEESLLFSITSPVTLRNDETEYPSRYKLFLPDGRELNVPDAKDGYLSVGSFEQAGIYRLRGLRGDPVSRGFSINVPAADTALQRMDENALNDQLGEENYRIARSMDEVESSVGQARFGRELYPLLMVLVAGLFLAEQAMSNRFYKLKFRKAS